MTPHYPAPPSFSESLALHAHFHLVTCVDSTSLTHNVPPFSPPPSFPPSSSSSLRSRRVRLPHWLRRGGTGERSVWHGALHSLRRAHWRGGDGWHGANRSSHGSFTPPVSSSTFYSHPTRHVFSFVLKLRESQACLAGHGTRRDQSPSWSEANSRFKSNQYSHKIRSRINWTTPRGNPIKLKWYVLVPVKSRRPERRRPVTLHEGVRGSCVAVPGLGQVSSNVVQIRQAGRMITRSAAQPVFYSLMCNRGELPLRIRKKRKKSTEQNFAQGHFYNSWGYWG